MFDQKIDVASIQERARRIAKEVAEELLIEAEEELLKSYDEIMDYVAERVPEEADALVTYITDNWLIVYAFDDLANEFLPDVIASEADDVHSFITGLAFYIWKSLITDAAAELIGGDDP